MIAKRNLRWIAGLLSVAILMQLIDPQWMHESFRQLRTWAAASNYQAYFQWDAEELMKAPENGRVEGDSVYDKDNTLLRQVTLTDGTALSVHEYEDESVILKTTFYFNPRQSVDAGKLVFTIEGLDELIRNGTLSMDMNDPNLVKTWDYRKDEANDCYIFTNKIPITSNNQTTFAWQFHSRTGITDTDLNLRTTCTVSEKTGEYDADGNPKYADVDLRTNPLTFHYDAEPDRSQVKIVCENLTELDPNNLNTAYEWRSYRSMLGLEGLIESAEKGGTETADDATTAHYIRPVMATQNASWQARGISSADYFIAVDHGGFGYENLLILDSAGKRVTLTQTEIDGKMVTGFYDFQNAGDRKPGENYSCVYRVGVLQNALDTTHRTVTLTGHYLVTYHDTTTPVDCTDTAAHELWSDSTEHPSGAHGEWITKYNDYEVNNAYTKNDIHYDSHAKPPSPVNQLLYNALFDGRTITYRLSAGTRRDSYNAYDLIYADSAPHLTRLKGEEPDHLLGYAEYDFTRIVVKKLVDGNTIGPQLNPDGTVRTDADGNVLYQEEKGYAYDIYGKSNDPSHAAYQNWTKLNDTALFTTEESSLNLPAGIDEIQVVVRNLRIHADLVVLVDIAYDLDDRYLKQIQIDTDTVHDAVDTTYLHKDSNTGSRLENTFTRYQYGLTDAGDSYSPEKTAVQKGADTSYSWLRESTTTIDSDTRMEAFQFHDVEDERKKAGEPTSGYVPGDYYSTVITAGGTIQSDTEKAVSHFIVYSQLPDGVTPSAEWLEAFKQSLTFSATELGTQQTMDAASVLENNEVTVWYDTENGCVTAEFLFEGRTVKSDRLIQVSFSYPAEISYARIKAAGIASSSFLTNTYVTVLDENTRLSPARNKALVSGIDPLNPAGRDAAKSSASRSITAMGSQKNNYATKSVKSFYNDWIYDTSTQVDGSNTDHLDAEQKRMTSEYSYQLTFHRITTGSEMVCNPVMLDIVEGLKTSAWNGTPQSVTFDPDSYPAGFSPIVYYFVRDGSNVRDCEPSDTVQDYSEVNETMMNVISHFQKYGEGNQENLSAQYADDLTYYNTLKTAIKEESGGWHSAEETNGVWHIDAAHGQVYAIAILFQGEAEVPDHYLELSANLHMKAPDMENDPDPSDTTHTINNNRATYNEVHVLAEGIEDDPSQTHFPMYSLSKRTLVILRHNVILQKVSAKNPNQRLTGATFTVFRSVQGNTFENAESNPNIVNYYEFNLKTGQDTRKIMKDMPVGMDGLLELNLSPGIYYYQETTSPPGYEPDETPYLFRVTSDANAVYYYNVALKTSDELDGEFLIVNSEEAKRYPNLYGNKTPVADEMLFHIYDADNQPVGFLRKEADAAYLYDAQDAAHQAEDTDVTFTNGLLTLRNLPAGTYFLSTSPKAAGDNRFEDGYVFSVADKSAITLQAFRKTPLAENVQFVVKQKLGSTVTANDPACLFTGSGGNYTLTDTTPADGTLLTPASDGAIHLTGLDAGKEYYFLLREVPQGFRQPNTSVMDVAGKDEVRFYAAEQLERTDRIVVENTPIEEATARFRKVDGTLYHNERVAADTQLNGAVYNMYAVENDGSEVLLYFTYDTALKTYMLAGKAASTGLTPDLQSDTIAEDMGMIQVGKLGYGTYFMREKEPPDGYEMSEEKKYFRVSASTIDRNNQVIFGKTTAADDTSQTDNVLTLELEDSERLSRIVLQKKDFQNQSQYLRNASYALYRLNTGADRAAAEQAVANAKGKPETFTGTDGFWTEVERGYTDHVGQLVFANLPFGTYLLYELQAPAGYTWNNDIAKWKTWDIMHPVKQQGQIIELNAQTLAANSKERTVTSTDEDGNESTTTIREYYPFYAEHSDDRRTGSARLLKTNADGKALTDGSFTLYQVQFTEAEKRAAVARYRNQLTAAQYNALPAGTKAALVAEVDVSAPQYAEDLAQLSLTQEDVILSEHIENGKPKLRTGTTETIDTVIKQNLNTADDPERGATETVSGLEWGVYYFYEVKAPAGYQQDTTPQLFTVHVRNVDEEIEVGMTDEKTYGKIWLYKQQKTADENGSHPKLFGAQFTLYTKAGKPVQAIPMLRLCGLCGGGDNTELGVKSGEKEFPVSGITDIMVPEPGKKQMTFTVLDDDYQTSYTVTVTYTENADGTITDVTPNAAFVAVYGQSGTYAPTPSQKGDTRLTYYAVSADRTKYYSDKQKRYLAFLTKPEQPAAPGADATAEEQQAYQEAMSAYHAAQTAYDKEQRLRACMTTNYVTADQGGQLCVRGLDWDSYYFRETVPPDGYGLAEDVVFTVNAYNADNQFLKCEDPAAQAAIIIDKEIPDAGYNAAYGEPTFLFRITKLKEAAEGETVVYSQNGTEYAKDDKTYTLAIHLTDPETSGAAMVNVDVGQYLIEELPVSRYTCKGLELVSGSGTVKVKSAGLQTPTSTVIAGDAAKYRIQDGTAQQPWTAFCDLTGGDTAFGEMLAFHVKYRNEIARYDHFSQVAFADNQIPGQAYITAFKPIYKELIPVNGGTENYTYTIPLRLTNDAQTGAAANFEGVLTYNTGETVALTDLRHIQFKTTGKTPIQEVAWDSDTNTLSVTISNPVSLAGQSVKLDVGYCADADFAAYNEQNTNMVKGELELSFSEVQAAKRKRVTYKNDANNRSYFGANASDGITAITMRYTKAEDTVTAEPQTGTLKPENLTIVSGYERLYWYLLDPEGRPVYNASKPTELIAFKDEAAVQAFVMDGTLPDGATLAEDSTFQNVERINSFTFQAEVAEIQVPKAKLLPGQQVSAKVIAVAGGKDNVKHFKKAEMSAMPAGTQNNSANIISVTDDRENFPKDVYIWYEAETGTVYYASDEPNPYMNEEAFEAGDGSDNPTRMNMFNNFTALETFEVCWDTSLVKSLRGMFTNCKKLTKADNTYTKGTLTPSSLTDMFQNCNALESCTILSNLDSVNLEDYRNVLQACSSLKADEMAKIFKTWDLTALANTNKAFNNNNRNETHFLGNNNSPSRDLCNYGNKRSVKYENGRTTYNNSSVAFRIYQCHGHKVMIVDSQNWQFYYIPDDSDIYINNVKVTDSDHHLIDTSTGNVVLYV